MSVIHVCDYCGEAIESHQPYVTFTVDGQHSDRRWSSGYVGHYHTDEPQRRELLARLADRREVDTRGLRDCWERVHGALQLAHEFGPTLESIPTASAQAIATRRRKHRKHEEA